MHKMAILKILIASVLSIAMIISLPIGILATDGELNDDFLRIIPGVDLFKINGE